MTEELPDELRRLISEARSHGDAGDLQEARRLWEEAFDVAEGMGSVRGDEVATELAARLAAEATDPQEALAWRTKAKALGAEAGTPRSLRIAADAVWTQADEHAQQGRAEKAAAAYQEAIDLGLEAGEAHGLATAAWASLDLGRVQAARGDPEAAAAALARGSELAERHETGFPDLEAMLAVPLGQARHELGDHEGALEAWQQALELGRSSPQGQEDVCRREAARASLAIGRLQDERGDPDAACPAYEEAIELGAFQHPGTDWHVGHRAALEAALRLAGHALADQDPGAAETWLARARGLLEQAAEGLSDEELEALAGSLAAEAQVAEPLARGWRALRQGTDQDPTS